MSKRKKAKELVAPSVRFVCLSRDHRTNVWAITCRCGNVIEPQTTMLSTQEVECRSCGRILLADYNAEPAKVSIPAEIPVDSARLLLHEIGQTVTDGERKEPE